MHFEATDLLHLPISLLGTVIMAVFLSRFLGKRYKSKKLYMLVFSAFFLVNTILAIFMTELIPYLTLIVCLVFSLALYGGTKVQRIVCGGLLTAYAFVSECLTMVVISYIFDYSVLDIRSNIIAYFVGAYASRVILFGFTILVTRKRTTKLIAIPNNYYLALLLVVWICAGLSFGHMIMIEQSNAAASLTHLLSEAASAILSIMVFFIFESFQIHAEEKARTNLMERQLLQEEQRFKLIDSQNQEVIAIKHDIANHLTSIHKLIVDGQFVDATKYLNECLDKASVALTRSITGKPSVDVLISEKMSLAMEAGISFDIKCDKLSEILISPYHLNTILSNALDNAIEACNMLPESMDRYISLGIKSDGDNLCIRIINSSLTKEIKDGELLSTSKEDKLRHGFGLSTIQRVAEQYNGVILCDYNAGAFTLYVNLMNNSAQF